MSKKKPKPKKTKQSEGYLYSSISGSRGKSSVDFVENYSSSNTTYVQGKDGKFRKKKVKRNKKRSSVAKNKRIGGHVPKAH